MTRSTAARSSARSADSIPRAAPRGRGGVARGGAARVEQLGEVRGQAAVVEFAAAEPSEGPGVGPARVRAQRGLGEPGIVSAMMKAIIVG